jgi:hypothetical protein
MAPLAAVKKKLVTMTETEVLDVIKAARGEKSIRDFAKEIGVSHSYVADILDGRRKPGAKILSCFGIGKTRRTIVEYVFFRK